MNRSHLVQTLEALAPALSKDQTIPIFQSYCFNGGEIYAYNDKIAIIGPVDFEPKCGLNGNILLGLLSNSNAEEVAMTLDGGECFLTLGKAEVQLPFQDESSFIFKTPIIKGNNLELTQSFMEALELCLETVSKDETQQKLHGVTLHKSKLYSCNGDTVTRIEIKASSRMQLFLPTDFCEALVKMWANLTMIKGELCFDDKWVGAIFDDWQIYGQLPHIENQINWDKEIQNTIKKEVKICEVPEGLDEALSRARVLADPESQKTKVSISKGKMHLSTVTHMGEIDDFVAIKNHPDVKANINAAYLQRALKHCDQMAVHDNCIVLEKAPNILLLIGNME